MSWPLIKYVLTASFRDRLVVAIFVLMLIGISMAMFMGSAAVIEKNEFSLVFAAGGLRVFGALGLIIFVVFHVRRSFESRDVDFLLSRPISRAGFLLSFASAFSILACVMGALVGGAIIVLHPDGLSGGPLYWAFSVVAEFIIIVNVSLFFSMWISSASASAILTIAFYILSRMMGQVLAIIDNNTANIGIDGVEVAVQAVSVIVPRLDLLGQTSWLLYGVNGGIDLFFIAMQAILFSALVLLASLIDLILRQF